MTYLTDDELVLRFADARPGRELVGIESIALPVTSLRVLVSGQEEKPLPLLDEFLLRALQLGLTDVGRVAALLGLERHLLEPPLVQQIAVGNVQYDGDFGHASLTSQGVGTATDLRALAPIEVEIPACFDRTIWRVTEYRERDLISKSEARKQGILVLPAARHSHLGTADIKRSDLEQLTRGPKSRRRRLQLLSVLKTSVSKHRYLAAKMLLFVAPGQTEPVLVWVVDGQESPMHARAIEEIDPTALREYTVRYDSDTLGIENLVASVPNAGTVEAAPLTVMEQQSFVRETLETARRRLMIDSSHVSAGTVDSLVFAQLAVLLRKGVEVIMRCELESPYSDEAVVERLRRLAIDNDRFHLVQRSRPTDCHIVVADSRILVTGMPLLGFKGSSDRRIWAGTGHLADDELVAREAFIRGKLPE